MFGEYGVYLNDEMIGSVCDDQLFVEPTILGRAHAEPVSDAPPYLSAEPQTLIAADRWDDAEWLGELLGITAAEQPTPKPRKPSEARKHLRRLRPRPSRPEPVCRHQDSPIYSRTNSERYGRNWRRS
ncbi:MAG: hypothetical protein ACRYFW_02795 [Janthinobacterium lividum]